MGQKDMQKRFSRPLAALALIALAACSGGPTAPPTANGGGPAPVPAGGAVVVGMGDSLTAGEQSNGLLGDPTVTNPASSYPGGAVPPGQMFGWFAQFYQQMTGTPASPILPLIKGPGLLSQIVLNSKTLFASTHPSCDAFNQAAYSLSASASTRLVPTAPTLDLGVPGITMHEAVAMTGPLTGPPTGAGCNFVSIPGDPTSGGLQTLVNAESTTFYPVLGGFQGALGSNLTQLNAAVSMKPQLTTVWLGANDLLKFIFSGSKSPITDSPTQLATDLTQIVTSLKATGSKVIVANLPDVLTTPQFFPQAKISADLQRLGAPANAANAVVAYLASQYGVTAGGYLTESGFLAVLQNLMAGNVTPNLDPSGPGSGLGAAYLTPAFAAQAQALNTGYNQAIGQVVTASGSGVALADVHAAFVAIASAGYSPVPGETMTLQFGGGLLSWDGLHPSNVGYAAIANIFIQAADTQLGMTIPPLGAAQLAAIANGGGPIPPDPYNPYVLKAGNPLSPFPLP